MADFELYSTSGCHLCDQAIAVITQVGVSPAIDWREVEIADSDDLMTRYGIRIPVLKHMSSDREIGWPFNEEQLAHWLAALPEG